jgi:hypothetical protein
MADLYAQQLGMSTFGAGGGGGAGGIGTSMIGPGSISGALGGQTMVAPDYDYYKKLLALQAHNENLAQRKDIMDMRVRKIANGFLLTVGGADYYCEDMIDVGKTVTAQMVRQFMDAKDSPASEGANRA